MAVDPAMQRSPAQPNVESFAFDSARTRLFRVSASNEPATTGVGPPVAASPFVGAPFPNPSRGGGLSFALQLESDTDVELALYDLSGRLVARRAPERFGLEYIDSDGQPKRPVMVHRAILGSFERFVGVLIEHYAGAFPTWLAPVQARVLPISEKHVEYARTVHGRLRAARLRAELDDRNEKLGYRIRDAQVRKGPSMLVVGAREAENGTVSLRHRTGDDLGAVPVERVLADLTREIAARDASLTVGRS